MNNVYISAYGLTKFRRSNDSIYLLAFEAIRDLINRFNIDKDSIDGIIVSTTSTEPYIANILADMLSLKPKISYKHEQLCSSGTSAIASAYAHIKAGLCNNILLIGVDKYDTIGKRLDWDIYRGEFKDPVYWAALYAKAHMKSFNTTKEQLALITVKNRKNALNNSYAYFQKPVDINDVLNSKTIVEPIKLLECSYVCDGAAAVLLTNKESSIKINNIGTYSIGASISSIRDLRSIESTYMAARIAYNNANINANKIDVAEIHDAFTICELLAYEDLGFVEKGRGGRFVEDIIDNKANVMINPRGGILGTGHPIGATGVAQIIGILNAIEENKYGLVHNMSAAGTTSNVIIMERI